MNNTPSGIALNVSRARLTLPGFVLTINVIAITNVTALFVTHLVSTNPMDYS